MTDPAGLDIGFSGLARIRYVNRVTISTEQ